MTLTADYKHIEIALVGEDGNAYFIMGRVQGEMRKNGCTPEEMEEVMNEMMGGDYNHLLNTVMTLFSVDSNGEEERYEEEHCDGCGEDYSYCDCYEDEEGCEV